MSNNVGTAPTPQKKQKKFRWLLLFFCGLTLVTFSVVSCGLYSAQHIRDVLVNSGYTEDWTDGVDGEFVDSISYGKKSWNKFDLYLPKELAPEKSKCAVLYIHGGSWSMGSRRDMGGFAKRCAKNGYVAASVEYMLFNQKDPSGYSMNVVLDEIDAALAKLKDVAKERGIELERVAIGGDSAGGHITSLYGYSRGKHAPIPVAFIAPRVAPIDFHADAWEGVAKPEVVALIASLMTRKSLDAKQVVEPDEEAEAAIASVSPLAFVTPENVLPTLAAYGAKDTLVGRGHCQKVRAAFEKLGAKSIRDVPADDQTTVVFDCLEYPNSGHMLDSDPDYWKRFQELFALYLERYLTTSVEASADAAE